MLEVRNLAFSYRQGPVLRNVSFVVSPGEVVSVVGGNGAGKTTLLRILATLAVPDEGLVLADGVNAYERPLRYRRQIGYLPESPALCEEMTVKDYLTYRACLKGEPVKRVRRRVTEAVEMCRVTDVFNSAIRRLSVGTKRRVALADALLLRPRILLLDDFLAGLDYEMRDVAGEILSDAAAFSAVIITGHELEDLARWTTRFLVLKGGTISSVLTTVGSDAREVRAQVDAALRGGAA